MRRLYIIGNGFDLHHGIPSSYSKFGEFLEERDSSIYQSVVDYLHADDIDFWSTFEQNLAHLDKNQLLEDASQFLVGYGAEDWSDANHHDYQYEIEKVVEHLSSKLVKRFTEWVRQLPIPSFGSYNRPLLKIDSNALFLSFNYTSTLTSLYHVHSENIWHIHGTAQEGELVLGHAWVEEEKEEEYDVDPDSIDVRIQQGDEIIESYFKTTFKPTEKIIADANCRFSMLRDIDEIYILGHSLGKVDIPYFLEIIKNIDISRVKWTVSYYEDDSYIRNQMNQLGIDASLIDYLELVDLS